MPTTPGAYPQPSQYPTSDAYDRALMHQGLNQPRPAVSDAVRAACGHCWHTLPKAQMCCWCGQPRARQHGPYAPEGE